MRLLRISLILEIVLGLAGGSLMGIFLASMAGGSPSAGLSDTLLGGFIGFAAPALFLILLPALAIREAARFPSRGKILWNLINTALLIPSPLFPLGLWQAFLLYRLAGGKGRGRGTDPKSDAPRLSPDLTGKEEGPRK